MNYFSGLTFGMGGSYPNYTVWHGHVPIYYGIQYNHTGTLRLRIDHQHEWVMSGPCVFLSHPGAFFEYGTADAKPRHHNYVCFFGPRVKRFIDGGILELSTDNPIVRMVRPHHFLHTLSDLIGLINLRKFDGLVQARMILTLEDLLLQIHESRLAINTTETVTAVRELILELDRAPEMSWNFQAEAQRLNITLEYLRRLFRKATGLPPQQYLIRQRLKLAAEMLVQGELPVSEIGSRVGIADEYYFSRLFKQHYTVAPLHYRREFAGITK